MAWMVVVMFGTDFGCHNPETGHSLVPVAAFSLPASSRQGKYHTRFLYLAMFGIYDSS